MKTLSDIRIQLLMAVITVLLGLSVAMQSFFIAKCWEHETRITKVETQIDLCNNTDLVLDGFRFE